MALHAPVSARDDARRATIAKKLGEPVIVVHDDDGSGNVIG